MKINYISKLLTLGSNCKIQQGILKPLLRLYHVLNLTNFFNKLTQVLGLLFRTDYLYTITDEKPVLITISVR